MKFWQGIVLYIFFQLCGWFLIPLLQLPWNAVGMTAICLATLLVAAVFLGGDAPARRMLLRARQPLLGWSVVLALGLRMLSEISVLLSNLFHASRNVSFMEGPLWAQLLYVVILAPITEETVMRGGLTIGLCYKMPWQAAVAITSVLFAVGHAWFQLPQTLFVAAVLGYLCWYTGSMVYGIVIHICINGSSFLLAPLYQWYYERYTVAVCVGVIVAGVALSLWSLRQMLRCADRLARFEQRFHLA